MVTDKIRTTLKYGIMGILTEIRKKLHLSYRICINIEICIKFSLTQGNYSFTQSGGYIFSFSTSTYFGVSVMSLFF